MNTKWMKLLLVGMMSISTVSIPNVHAAAGTTIDHLGRYGTWTASNDDNGQTPPSRAGDGIIGRQNRWGTSTWSTLKDGHHVQVNFKDVNTVKDFKITFENRSDVQGNTNILKYHIEAIKEGKSAFETIYTSTSTVKQIEEFSLTQSEKVTALKLVIDEIKSSSYNNCNVEEFEIYGDRSIEATKGVNHALASKGTTIDVSSTEHHTLHKDHLNDGIQTDTPAKDGETNPNRWASADATPTITLNFKKTTQVQEVFVNFWRNCKPFYNQIEAFDIVYTDEVGKDHTVTVKNTLVNGYSGDQQGYEDTVTYVFDKPVNMQKMKLTNFKTKACSYNTPSIEEIEVYSFKRETTPPTVDVEDRDNRNHLVDATMAVSSTETNDGRFGATLLNNGVAKTDANNKSDRWSAKASNEWVTAKLKKATKIQELDFYLFTRDADPMPSNIKSFNIQLTKLDGKVETIKVNNTTKDGGWSDRIQVQLDQPIIATDIRIDGFVVDGKQYPNVSINEIEIYSNKQKKVHNLSTVASSIKGEEIAKGTAVLPKPVMPEGYTVEFNGCDLEQIVDSKLNIHTPLVDKDVNISWIVTETASGKKQKTNDIVYKIKGEHTASVEGMNGSPIVIPEIQEWYSDTVAKLNPARLETVVYTDPSLEKVVDEFISDYLFFSGKVLKKSLGTTPQPNAIYFEKTSDLSYLGDEGYTMDIKADRIVVRSSHVTGNMYGMQTILQMYKQSSTEFAVGQIHDYPRYEVRGFVFDVARKPVSMAMLKDVAKTMRYYKMNDFQVHLNDNYIFLEHYKKTKNPADAYEAFRLESDLTNSKGESPSAKDYHYSKKELKEFITTQRELGMNIVPEIDVPAHSLSFTKIWKELSLDGKFNPRIGDRSLIDHWDLTNPKAIEKIKEIFDEYTSKGDNIFDKETIVHVGADEFEYNATAYRKFINEIIPYLKKTNDVRIWGGLTWINDHKTQIIEEAVKGVQINLWSKDWSDGIDMYNMGYEIINTIDCYNYMVPNGSLTTGGYYPDLLRKDSLFNEFEVNKVRRRGGGFAPIPSGDKQMDGAAFAIWNDNIDKSSCGLTESDEYYRFFDAMPIYAEKTWAATGKEKGSAARISAIAKQKGTGPNTNPYYEADSKNGEYMKYDFSSLNDLTANDRDLTLGVNAQVDKGVLTLNGGQSFVSTPLNQLGNGNTLSFDITLDKPYKAGDIIFEESSAYGTHDLRIMKDGRLGFTRELHDYYFNYRLPIGEKVNIKIVVDRQVTKLYVNNVLVGTATGEFVHNGIVKKTGINHATFALPLERIGSKTQSINATIDNVSVYSTINIEQPPVVDPLNKAGWTSGGVDSETVSGGEPKEGQLYKAFDNNPNTHWHSNWNGATDKVPSINGTAGSGKGQDGSIWAVINFNQKINTNNFSFTPRLDGNTEGNVTVASLQVQKPDGTWVTVADKQQFANDTSKKTFFFAEQEIIGVRFEAFQSSKGWVTVSEFDITPIDKKIQLFITENTLGSVSVSPESVDSKYSFGQELTVEAKANPGYKFVKWINSITGETVCDKASYTFNLVSENSCIEPVYEVDPDYVDRTKLDAAILNAEAIDTTLYTDETVKALNDALAAAKNLPLTASQLEVDNATTALIKAIDALVEKEVVTPAVVDKSKLDALVNEVNKLDSKEYTTESYSLLKEALVNATNVLKDTQATQKAVDDAYNALLKAKEGLVKVGVVTPTPEQPEDQSQEQLQPPVDNETQQKPTPTGDVHMVEMFVTTMLLACGGIFISMRKRKQND